VTADEIKKRFDDEIDRRGRDDRFIDRNEEREILQIALQLGMPADCARAALAEVCAGRGYVQETHLEQVVREWVAEADAIDQATFHEIAADVVRKANGTQTERQARALVVQVLADTGAAKVKTGWLRDWFKAAKRELGVA
jgi:hypothetical protein